MIPGTLRARRGPWNDVELVLGEQRVFVLVGAWQRLVRHLEEHQTRDGGYQEAVEVSVVVAPEAP